MKSPEPLDIGGFLLIVFHGAMLHIYHIKCDKTLLKLVHERIGSHELGEVLGGEQGAGLSAVRLTKAEVTGEDNRQLVRCEVQFVGVAKRFEEKRVIQVDLNVYNTSHRGQNVAVRNVLLSGDQKNLVTEFRARILHGKDT